MNCKIFGDRVLVKEVDEKDREVGGIYLPESASRTYHMVEVIEVGDGRMRGVDGILQRKMCVSKGDRVMIQANPMMAAANLQRIDGVRYLALNHHDIIARIGAGIFDLTISAFKPIGKWVLVRIDAPEKVGMIYLPNQKMPLQSAGEIKTYLADLGEIAAEELGYPPIGTRFMLEHSRVNPLKLGKVSCAYVDVSNVAGMMPADINIDHLDS